jgi:hypothetical protein
MNTKRIFTQFTLAMSLAIVAVCIITSAAPLAFAAQEQKFIAKLTGQNEVPPINTKATGNLEMELSPDGTVTHYVLSVTNISNVISAELHEGSNGKNGPIIETLYPFHPHGIPVNPKSLINGTILNGTLSEGKVYTDLLEGPFAGKHLSDLIVLINNGNAYVNINTKQHPLGEIRGQLGASYITVPEFKNATITIVFVLAFIAIIVVSKKYNMNSSVIKKH